MTPNELPSMRFLPTVIHLSVAAARHAHGLSAALGAKLGACGTCFCKPDSCAGCQSLLVIFIGTYAYKALM